MRYLICTYLILGIFIICSSCSNKQYQSLFEQKSSIADSLTKKSTAGLNYYRIQPQDILQIRNLQNINYIVYEAPVNANTSVGTASLGQTFQVEEDGTVPLPVLGRVAVVGLTRVEAEKLIEDLYRKKLLKDPIIELKIINLKVTILDEVKAQGEYVLIKDKTTLVQLIGQAGGLTERANEKNIKIIRGGENKPQVTEVNLNNIQSISDPATILHNGDIIYIAQNKRAVRNDNLQNFSIITQPALLLFNTALIILTLIRH